MLFGRDLPYAENPDSEYVCQPIATWRADADEKWQWVYLALMLTYLSRGPVQKILVGRWAIAIHAHTLIRLSWQPFNERT